MLHEVRATSGRRISFEEFLGRDDEFPAEWVDGAVVPMVAVSLQHSDLAGFLIMSLRAYADIRGLGVIHHEPFVMKTGPDLPGRSPDLLFLSAGNLGRLRENHLEGPADLVVEIVSSESRARDRGEKYYEYEQGGVGEYWLLDPQRRQAEFYQLSAAGVYRPVMPDRSGLYRSRQMEGLWIRTDWLWGPPFPGLLDVLRGWGLLAP